MSITTEMLVQKTKDNIYQLLYIGLNNTDENIKQTYGGEDGLISLIKQYYCLLEDLEGFKKREFIEDSKVKQ